MKYFNMPNAVAGVIALAAALGLVRHERETERKAPVRMSVVARESSNAKAPSGSQRPFAIDSETGLVYFVETSANNKAEDAAADATAHIPRPSRSNLSQQA